MATTKDSERHHRFYILNVKLRKNDSQVDLPPDEYVKLFKKAHQRKVHKQASAGKHCIFRFIFEEKENDKTLYLSGTFFHFTYIKNERWLNLQNLDIDDEFHVPDGLVPEAKIAEFVFIPDAHRFCYKQTSEITMSPYTIKAFLEKALDEVTEQNQYVQVDVETERSTIDKILGAKEVRKLIIDVNYSNSDFGDEFKKFVEEDIKKSDTQQFKIEAKQKPKTSIKISESTILLGALKSSISNGEAEATIIGEDNKVDYIKTSDYPLREKVIGTSSRFPALVYQKIMKLFRPNGN